MCIRDSCEDESLLTGGYIHDGDYAKAHSHKGICSESEWKQVERDVALAEKTGEAYHVCHVSTKESVDIIRKAKARGVDVTCETGPHYLVLCDEDLQEDGWFKMNQMCIRDRLRASRLFLFIGYRAVCSAAITVRRYCRHSGSLCRRHRRRCPYAK